MPETDERTIDFKGLGVKRGLAAMIDAVHELGMGGDDMLSINVKGLESFYHEMERLQGIAIGYARAELDDAIATAYDNFAGSPDRSAEYLEEIADLDTELKRRIEEITNG